MNALQMLAEKLDGREYASELTKEEVDFAKVNRAVIVLGASDDIMLLAGAIDDEVDCYGGGLAHFNKRGLIKNECDDEHCPYHLREIEEAAVIEAVWGEEDYSWTYKTDIPHETFDILEDGEKYCRGIVFSLDNL